MEVQDRLLLYSKVSARKYSSPVICMENAYHISIPYEALEHAPMLQIDGIYDSTV
jgi:hypothetical protein